MSTSSDSEHDHLGEDSTSSDSEPAHPREDSKRRKRCQPEKWKSLHHMGPCFAPPYEPLPLDVHFYYDGEPIRLSPPAEEVATFYAQMLDNEYTTKEMFNKNFFDDWVKYMTAEERRTIRDLNKCDFKEMHAFFVTAREARKNRSKEEKEKMKKEAAEMQSVYGYCTVDGRKERVINFRVLPPGLFRGRGYHPKMGKVKRRIQPEDIIINCSRDSVVPTPPEGHRWKEVRHDSHVLWLARWRDDVQGSFHYIWPRCEIYRESSGQRVVEIVEGTGQGRDESYQPVDSSASCLVQKMDRLSLN